LRRAVLAEIETGVLFPPKWPANTLAATRRKSVPLRDALEEGILSSIPETELDDHKIRRLANTTNITFLGIESEALPASNPI
jgi:cysteine sulfinate desulfinase/cysteine desulfurase-like protein